MRLFSPSVLNRRVGPATSVRRSGRLGTRRVRRRRAMAASARPARRLGGACGANRCLLVSALLALAWLARKHGATSGGLNLVVPDRAHAAVIPHIQRADLAGFVTAHARHDPAGALERVNRPDSEGRTRRRGVGFGSERGVGAFPEARGDVVVDDSFDVDAVASDPDPVWADTLDPAIPEPPSPPPKPTSAHRNAAPGSGFWRPPLPPHPPAATSARRRAS